MIYNSDFDPDSDSDSASESTSSLGSAGNEVAPKYAASSTIFNLNQQDAVGAGKCLWHGFFSLLLIWNGAKYNSLSDVTVMQNQSSFTSLCRSDYSTDECDKATTEWPLINTYDLHFIGSELSEKTVRSRISDAFEKIRGVNFAREELQMFRYNRFNTAVVFATAFSLCCSNVCDSIEMVFCLQAACWVSLFAQIWDCAVVTVLYQHCATLFKCYNSIVWNKIQQGIHQWFSSLSTEMCFNGERPLNQPSISHLSDRFVLFVRLVPQSVCPYSVISCRK